MRLESVRALKAELFAEQTTKAFATRRAFRRTARIRCFPSRPKETLVPFALGVAGKRRRYKLAVRVLTAAPWVESVIEAMSHRARGEIDIRFVGPVFKQQPWHRRRNRPLRIGGSLGHVDITAGTLGCFVTRRGGGTAEDECEDLILSNNHVLADENSAASGDTIIQPGYSDGGRAPRDKVGELRKFVRLKRKGANFVDAAAAAMRGGIEYYYNWLEGLGEIKGVRADDIEPGDRVAKVGRTTGMTHGEITAVEVDDLVVGYDMGDLTFDDQIEIAPADAKPFSLGGDSGSLIVDMERRAVGLLFAGNDKSATFANPIQAVLDGLDVDLVY